MSLENSQQTATAAVQRILKNSGADSVLLLVVKDGESILASEGNKKGLASMIPAVAKAQKALINKCMSSPEAIIEMLDQMEAADKAGDE